MQKDTKEEKKWYVYMHTNKINQKKYIGITCQEPNERWKNGLGYKTQTVFWRAIQKYGWSGFEHIVVANNLTENEAKQKEIELIALYKTNCNRYKNPSYGYNCTDGGDGMSGWAPSEEIKNKIRQSLIGVMSGEKHPFFGKQHSEKTKQQMSKSKIGNKNYMYRTHNNGGKGGKQSIPVYCIELDSIFKGAKKAGIDNNIAQSDITKCCNKTRMSAGKHPETGNKLHWLYAKDAVAEGYITQQELDNYLNELKKGNDINGKSKKR